jgi:nucleotide-binding universal stress UspA family protein
MSNTVAVVAVVIGWCSIGVAISYLMARRGHDAYSWWLVGFVFGPLALALMLDKLWQQRRRSSGRSLVTRIEREEGKINVLVGIDGSPEAEAAAAAVPALLGSRMGRLTLATVLHHDTPVWSEQRREASAAIELAALHTPGVEVDTVFLRGRPDEELERHARAGGYQLLAVGGRGTAMSTALLGSVATRLARSSGIPVLITAMRPPASARRKTAATAVDRGLLRVGGRLALPMSASHTWKGGENHVG